MTLAVRQERAASDTRRLLAAHRPGRPSRPSRRGVPCAVILLLASALAACASVKISEEDEQAMQAAVVAKDVAARLARLEDDFRAGWAQARDTPARLAVLDRLRSELAVALAGPELAAARDYVAAGIDEALPQLSETRDHARLRLVATTPAPAPPPAVAARIRTVRQRAEASDLLASLCVITEPTVAARFRLWPQSYPPRIAESAVIGQVRVYRGLYAYRLEPQGGRRVIQCDQRLDPKCPRLDLMADDSRIFACNLDLGGCSRRPGNAGAFKGCTNSG